MRYLLMLVCLCFALPAFAAEPAAAPTAAPLFDWHPLTSMLVQGLGVLIMGVITAIGALIVRKINASSRSEAEKQTLIRISNVIGMSVSEVMQTTIDAARKAAGSGALPKEIAEKALQEALDKTKAYVSQADMKTVMAMFGLDTPEKLNAFLTSNIEATVRMLKPQKPGASPAGFMTPN